MAVRGGGGGHLEPGLRGGNGRRADRDLQALGFTRLQPRTVGRCHGVLDRPVEAVAADPNRFESEDLALRNGGHVG